MDPYTEAHLYVAGIRLLYHQKQNPPTIEDICGLLDISEEHGIAVYRRLEKLGIVEIIESPFARHLNIADHLKIEELSKSEESQGSMAQEVEKFMAKKRDFEKEAREIEAEIKKKQQDMFKDLDAQLKKKMGEMKKK